ASTPVRFRSTGGITEDEQFIFYRGLGMFDPPVHIVAGAGGALHIRSTASDDVAAVFLLTASGSAGRIVHLGGLRAGQTLDAAVPAADAPAYVADARGQLLGALVGTGLKADVAQAMVDTWSRSWFKNQGLRVLYLAPRAWTDAYLPTEITPAPESI